MCGLDTIILCLPGCFLWNAYDFGNKSVPSDNGVSVVRMHYSYCRYCSVTRQMQLGVPNHRFTPLKENWLALYKPVTEQLKLDMRMNLKTKKVRLAIIPSFL